MRSQQPQAESRLLNGRPEGHRFRGQSDRISRTYRHPCFPVHNNGRTTDSDNSCPGRSNDRASSAARESKVITHPAISIGRREKWSWEGMEERLARDGKDPVEATVSTRCPARPPWLPLSLTHTHTSGGSCSGSEQRKTRVSLRRLARGVYVPYRDRCARRACACAHIGRRQGQTNGKRGNKAWRCGDAAQAAAASSKRHKEGEATRRRKRWRRGSLQHKRTVMHEDSAPVRGKLDTSSGTITCGCWPEPLHRWLHCKAQGGTHRLFMRSCSNVDSDRGFGVAGWQLVGVRPSVLLSLRGSRVRVFLGHLWIKWTESSGSGRVLPQDMHTQEMRNTMSGTGRAWSQKGFHGRTVGAAVQHSQDGLIASRQDSCGDASCTSIRVPVSVKHSLSRASWCLVPACVGCWYGDGDCRLHEHRRPNVHVPTKVAVCEIGLKQTPEHGQNMQDHVKVHYNHVSDVLDGGVRERLETCLRDDSAPKCLTRSFSTTKRDPGVGLKGITDNNKKNKLSGDGRWWCTTTRSSLRAVRLRGGVGIATALL